MGKTVPKCPSLVLPPQDSTMTTKKRHQPELFGIAKGSLAYQGPTIRVCHLLQQAKAKAMRL
jgi:hypothetical protein